MSTLEALNAISEAIEAHKLLPDIQRQLKEAREAHDFALLELEEANAKIAELRAIIADQSNTVTHLNETIKEQLSTISELRDRNNMLADSLDDAQNVIRNQESTLTERSLTIESLSLTKASLESKLLESRTIADRLTETLKSIGAKIVAAVEVPEVTPSAPFPVVNPVAMPDSPSDQSNDQSSSEPNGNVAEPTDADLVSDVASGCNVYRYW